ncbi:MAG TPA: flap endonuclease-1 [Geobacterales bacterium]|nr:flap endonuclease-1 [Geobacterales bacterium]
MGTNLAPIVKREIITLKHLSGKTLAVDASIELHQFLALIRKPDGSLFTNKEGRITSHLIGLLFRTTRLISEFGIDLIFVFDGKAPKLKERILIERKIAKEKAIKEWLEAIIKKDYRKAFSKAVVTGKLDEDIIKSAKRLLKLLGIPYVEAPSEAEAQASYIASKGDAWACATKDYDAILFGPPRVVRYLSIKGYEFLPSKGIMREIKPELVDTERLFKELGITREQMIDIAILVGTDFNDGVKGIGPKKALQLIKEYKSLEGLPYEIREKLPVNYQEIREFFLRPPVNSDYEILRYEMDEEGLKEFLVEEMDFKEERVNIAIERIRKRREQGSIVDWFKD